MVMSSMRVYAAIRKIIHIEQQKQENISHFKSVLDDNSLTYVCRKGNNLKIDSPQNRNKRHIIFRQ